MRPRILLRPMELHLNQTEAWLQTEYRNEGEGFYCNWNVITKAFKGREIAVALIEEKAVAFIIWWRLKEEAGLSILSVKPNLRNHGIGRTLANRILSKFEKAGVKKVSIECQPFTSEPFWRRLGFVDDPAHPYHRVHGMPAPSPHLQKVLGRNAL